MLLQRSLMARLEQWNVGILLGCLAQNLDLPPEIAFGCKPAFGLSNQLRCTLAIRVLNIELECAEKSMPGEANEHLVASLESSTEVARLVERTGFRQSFRGAPGSFANALVQSTQFGSVRFGIGRTLLQFHGSSDQLQGAIRGTILQRLLRLSSEAPLFINQPVVLVFAALDLRSQLNRIRLVWPDGERFLD